MSQGSQRVNGLPFGRSGLDIQQPRAGIMKELESATPRVERLRTEAFQIENWQVDPASNQLLCTKTGEQRSLEPRLMHLLCLLAATPGSVKTREALISALWPRVIVNENSLTRAISELRKKLEDRASGKRLIDTIPKTGYRLSAACLVREIREIPASPVASALVVPDVLPGFWQQQAKRWREVPRQFALSAMALGSLFLLGGHWAPLQSSLEMPNTSVLADIRVENTSAVNSLIGGHLEKVASTQGMTAAELGTANATSPVVSRDGRLFALIRYSDEGSSLLLGSTDLPNSPVTVLSTPDTLYNLQWSPINRALLFAQAPRITPAALLPEDQASLVLFDIDSFTTRVIQGPDLPADKRADDKETSRGFSLTSLTRRFDWMS